MDLLTGFSVKAESPDSPDWQRTTYNLNGKWLPRFYRALESASKASALSTAYDTIRYDTIVEFNVDSKAEYTA